MSEETTWAFLMTSVGVFSTLTGGWTVSRAGGGWFDFLRPLESCPCLHCSIGRGSHDGRRGRS